MSTNLEEFGKYMAATHVQGQEALAREANIEVNGSDKYYKAWSREIDLHPIGRLGTRGLVGCCF